MRIKWFAQAAACALVMSSVHVAAEAKPKRPAAGAIAKKKAAAAAAARKEADRLAAEAAAKVAAEAAEKARIRAQWGVLADIGDSDFEMRDIPVTFRRIDGGNAIEMISWSSFGRGVSRISRDGANGTLSFVAGKAAPVTLKALADGTLEASDAKGVRWPFAKRLASGELEWMNSAGNSATLRPIGGSSKAAARLSKLVAAGKVAAVGAPASATGTAQVAASPSGGGILGSLANAVIGRSSAPASDSAGGIPSMATVQATEGFDLFRQLYGDWWNGSVKWSIAPVAGAVVIEGSAVGSAPSQRKLELRDGKLLLDRSQAVPLAGGAYFPKRGYAVVRKDEGFVVTAGKMKGGSFVAGRDQSLGYLGEYRRMTPEIEQAFRKEVRAYEVAQAEAAAERARQKAASGNSGFLGGLIMGGMAAAMGADANIVMAAAAKGVEMTTDDENTRAAMSGISNDFIQNKNEIDAQKAELERLRVAAEDETRRKREAEAAGRSYAPAAAAPVKTASAAPNVSASSQGKSTASSGEELTKKSVRAYFWVSTVPGPKDTHNTHCQSTVFSFTMDWNPRGWGNQGRANAILDPMMPTFLAKCGRQAQITSAANATTFVEGIQYSFSEPPLKAGDVRVTMP